MARIKYGPAVAPLFNGNPGYTFMPNPVGQSMKTNARPRHMRSDIQLDKMSMFSSIARTWHHLSQSEQDAWLAWTVYLPQHTNRDPLVFLKPFQNYEKRNFYKFLQEGPAFTLMVNPELVTYEIDLPVFTTTVGNGRLILHYNFSRGNGDLRVSVFVVSFHWSSVNTTRSLDRYILTIPNEDGSTDITDEFIAHFGFIPALNDSVLIRSVECGFDNGQFFYPEVEKVIVTPDILPPANVKYGLLYNWFTASSPKLFKPGWHVPTTAEFETLQTYLGGWNVAGGPLKETGFIYWFNPNLGATNSANFFGRGSGRRLETGVFNYMNADGLTWSSSSLPGTPYKIFWSLWYAQPYFTSSNYTPTYGASIRLICDSTTDPGFVDIDGYRYNTVKIGNQVWMAEYLKATKFEDGTVIPEVTDATAWSNLTSPGLCAYDNNWSNV